MIERLTRENLAGVWCAVHTPWDDAGAFDPGILRENLQRLQAAGVHGVYTTDSDGEYYAIELDEFRQIVKVFAGECDRLRLPAQVGVTWSSTAGILARLRTAAECGILGAHVGHPSFMPMNHPSYEAFWQDVQHAVPEWFALVHYNSPRLPNYQYGADYARLQRIAPNLVGSKHVSSDFVEFTNLVAAAPALSHFTSEYAFTPFTLFGAKGVNSWFANFNAKYMVDWYGEMQRGEWDKARHRQQRMQAFIRATDVFVQEGSLHGILGKAIAASSSFLVMPNRTRRPYLPVPQASIERFENIVREQFEDMMWQG